MSDAVPACLFVALCGVILAWILTYRALSRYLRRRHPAIFGASTRRKNGMDQFFAVLGFLFRKGDAALGDRRLWFRCVLLKSWTALIVLVFLAMMFAPMFIREDPARSHDTDSTPASSR
ncbi:MAG: hypothetical protein PHC88_15255 [Terrimicrobiaceae bacterium]|nr:hypothetical protein [Terrimicrobiaceae bacterium]